MQGEDSDNSIDRSFKIKAPTSSLSNPSHLKVDSLKNEQTMIFGDSYYGEGEPSFTSFIESARASGFTLPENDIVNIDESTDLSTHTLRTVIATSVDDLEEQLSLYDNARALLCVRYDGEVVDVETAQRLALLIAGIEGTFKMEFSSTLAQISTQVIPILFAPLSLKQVNVVSLELSFKHNGFADASAAALAELIRRNATLRSIDLRSCGVGDAGALALVTALAAHPKLARVCLRSNAVSEQGARNLLIHLSLYPLARSVSINVADNSISVETQRKLRRVVNGKPYPTLLYDEDDLFPQPCPCRCERCLFRNSNNTLVSSLNASNQNANVALSNRKRTQQNNNHHVLPQTTQLQPLLALPTSVSARVVSAVSALETAQTSTLAPPSDLPGRLPQAFRCVCVCGVNSTTPLYLTDSDDDFSEKEKEMLRQQPLTLVDIAAKTVAENEQLYTRETIQKTSLPPHIKQKVIELKALKRQKAIALKETLQRRHRTTPPPWPFPTGDFTQQEPKK